LPIYNTVQISLRGLSVRWNWMILASLDLLERDIHDSSTIGSNMVDIGANAGARYPSRYPPCQNISSTQLIVHMVFSAASCRSTDNTSLEQANPPIGRLPCFASLLSRYR
jgi:hypothetical protein